MVIAPIVDRDVDRVGVRDSQVRAAPLRREQRRHDTDREGSAIVKFAPLVSEKFAGVTTPGVVAVTV